jgi:hypothetical protein
VPVSVPPHLFRCPYESKVGQRFKTLCRLEDDDDNNNVDTVETNCGDVEEIGLVKHMVLWQASLLY